MTLPENWRDLEPEEQIRWFRKELNWYINRDKKMQKLIERLYDL